MVAGFVCPYEWVERVRLGKIEGWDWVAQIAVALVDKEVLRL